MPTGCLAQQRRLRRSQHGWPRHTAMPPRSIHQNAVMVRFPGKTAVEVSSLGTPCIPALPRVGILVATCCRFSPPPLWSAVLPSHPSFLHILLQPAATAATATRLCRSSLSFQSPKVNLKSESKVRKIQSVALNLKSESREVQKSNPKSKSQFGPGPEVRKSIPKSESKVRKINLGRSSPPAIRTSVRSPNPESECVQIEK